jgi:hypothetical protein
MTGFVSMRSHKAKGNNDGRRDDGRLLESAVLRQARLTPIVKSLATRRLKMENPPTESQQIESRPFA